MKKNRSRKFRETVPSISLSYTTDLLSLALSVHFKGLLTCSWASSENNKIILKGKPTCHRQRVTAQ